jgi:predicted nucleotidyltransferase
MIELEDLPKEIKEDIDSIKSILLNAGAAEIYLFGSYAEGDYQVESDIDIAFTGIDKSKFFKVYGAVLSSIGRNVDMISLDYQTDFSKELKKNARFVRVAWLAKVNIELEFKQIEIEVEIVENLNRIRRENNLDEIQIRAAASSLHSIHNGIEKILV